LSNIHALTAVDLKVFPAAHAAIEACFDVNEFEDNQDREDLLEALLGRRRAGNYERWIAAPRLS
jgi:hypothetical protein